MIPLQVLQRVAIWIALVQLDGGLDMSSTDFHVDFESDVSEFGNEVRIAAEKRLRDLAGPHPEIDHATVAVTRSSSGEEPAQFEARVTVYASPEDITVTKKAYQAVQALDETLAEIERLIRERYAENE